MMVLMSAVNFRNSSNSLRGYGNIPAEFYVLLLDTLFKSSKPGGTVYTIKLFDGRMGRMIATLAMVLLPTLRGL